MPRKPEKGQHTCGVPDPSFYLLHRESGVFGHDALTFWETLDITNDDMEGRISPFSVETHDEFIESLLNTPKSTEQLPQPKSLPVPVHIRV